MSAPDTTVALTCKYCLNEQVRNCLKCDSRYCVLHAAKFSPNFCKDCLTNLASIVESANRSSTEYDMLDNELIIKTIQTKTLRLDGPDWIFYSQYIQNISDDDWSELYQFHYFILKMMEHENELRKVKRARRVASAPLSTKITSESKTRKTTQPIDVQAKLEKKGFKPAAIKAMLAALGIAYKEPNANNNGNG